MGENIKMFLLNDAIKMRKKDIILFLIEHYKIKPNEALKIYNNFIKMENK